MALSLQQIAEAVHGEIVGDCVQCAGPGHSAADRSLSIWLSDRPPGFTTHSFADDPFQTCRDFICEKLKLPKFQPNGKSAPISDEVISSAVAAAAASQTRKTSRPHTAEYHYKDRDGTLLYRVLRFDHPKKHFAFDWKTEDRRRVLYRWDEILQFPDATIFVVEGEKDADNVAALGLCATTVASGRWTDDCVQALAGRDVVIIPDNDGTGRDKALKAATLLQPVTHKIRMCELPGLPVKGDATDWIDAGGTAEKLQRLIEDLSDWEPGPELPQVAAPPLAPAEPEPENTALVPAVKPIGTVAPISNSKSLVAYPLVAFEHVPLSSERTYLVKGILPRIGLCVIWGPPKCGKTFWAMDIFLHVALGRDYRGHKVQQTPIIYCALEGHGGYGRRIAALRQHYDITSAPFYLLKAKINLRAEVNKLIKDVEAQGVNPGAIVIDTLNRSLAGSESSDEDMGKYLEACGKIEQHFNCLIAPIHHCGYDASHPRGHTSLPCNVDAQIAVSRGGYGEVIARTELAKDDAVDVEIISTLHNVDVGFDVEGDPIGSMVVVPADGAPTARPAFSLQGVTKLAHNALIEALAEAGEIPSEPSSHIPPNTPAVTEKIWTEWFVRTTPGNYSDPDNARRALVRAATKLKNMKMIGIWKGYVWICR